MSAHQMKKAAAGEQTAFGKISNDKTKIAATCSIRQYAKRLIVKLALWGLIPIPAAEWLIQRGGLSHE